MADNIFLNGRKIQTEAGEEVLDLDNIAASGTSVTDGSVVGDVLVWDGDSYEPEQPSAVTLKWDGVSNYSPSKYRASTAPKTFIGPTDPSGLTGVSFNDYDRWIQTA